MGFWWFGRKSAPADMRPFVPAWLNSAEAEEGFARFLTFEVVADEAPPTIAAIVADASRGVIACDAAEEIGGYAAYGQSIKAAIQPVIGSYGVDLFDDGSVVRGPLPTAVTVVGDADLGNSADGERAPKIRREQLPSRDLPAALRFSYYDPARDYQTAEARASAGEQSGNEEQRELPAVLNTDAARSLVEQSLARAWASRDKLTLRLSPSSLVLEPGAKLQLALSPSRWTIERCTIDSFVVVAELRPSWRPSAAVPGDPGRIVSANDVVAGELSLALFDVPDVLEQSVSVPTLLLAASTPTRGWARRSVAVGLPQQSATIQAPSRKAVLGQALDVLAGSEPYLMDMIGSVEVELIDKDQWLVSCDDEALANGANLAALGSELLQFGHAVPTGPGRFRLSRFLRGRGATEWAASVHGTGEAFALVDSSSLRAVPVPVWWTGATVTASALNSSGASCIVGAESLRPLAPVRLQAEVQTNGDLALSWTRRSRRGWSWIDQVDTPVGEGREHYRVTFVGPSASAELSSDQSAITVAASELVIVGAGPVTVQVVQVGDFGVSRPAECILNLP
jgi:hypothetical protein